jgi:2,4-dichlorophenol 6-monooxygenase
MRQLEIVEVPVLVVGAGPVGLTASLLLAQQGLENLVVDRREGPHRAPQAHVVNPRTLEICRAAGIDTDALRKHATPRADGSHVRWMTTLAGKELGCLPYERQGDEVLAYTPTPLLNLSQHLFEPILLERVRNEIGTTVRYRHQWSALEQEANAVSSVIEDLETGESYRVRSRYVLAADGAASRVRKSLGIEMAGPDRLQSFVMIHFQGDLRALVKQRPAILYWIVNPDTPGSLVAHDIDTTWVFMHPYDPETESTAAYTAETCAGIIRGAIGSDEVDFTVRDISTWTMTAQVADRYAADNVFLVGDSAHRFPPTGGMGMNTGIQDAHNLVWKLRGVESSWAPASLLGTYELERRPIAQHNADRSLVNAVKLLELFEKMGLTADPAHSRTHMAELLADPAASERLGQAIADQQDHFDMLGLQLGFAYESGAIVPDGSAKPAVDNPVADFVPTSRPGSRLPHAWVERDGVRVSTLDLLPYDRFTLLAGADCGAWAEAVAAIESLPLQCLIAERDFGDPDGHWAEVSEIARGGALLVRPDQHVAWRVATMPTDPRGELTTALRSILGGA